MYVSLVMAAPPPPPRFTPSSSVHRYISNPTQWNVEFDHTTTIRRLVAHHPELLITESPDFKFVAFAANATKSSRSSVVRNAILLLEVRTDIYHPSNLGTDLGNG